MSDEVSLEVREWCIRIQHGEWGLTLWRRVRELEAENVALRVALAAQTRHATTLGVALTGQEDGWTEPEHYAYRPSQHPAPQRMESML